MFGGGSSLGTKFPANKKRHSSAAWQGLIEHVCAYNQDLCIQSGSLSPKTKKRRGYLEFCAENIGNLRSCLVITLFQYGINFGR